MTNEDVSPSETKRDRQYLPNLADLVDRLTIDQIKTVMLPDNKPAVEEEMNRLEYDIDTVIDEKELKLSGKVLRIVIFLAQLNLHIWNCKDRMEVEPDKYEEWLTFAHQLNGVKNQMKNLLNEEVGGTEASVPHTNVATDGLHGWDIKIG